MLLQGADRSLFIAVAAQLKSPASHSQSGYTGGCRNHCLASEEDEDARWIQHKGKHVVNVLKATVGAEADRRPSLRKWRFHPSISITAWRLPKRCLIIAAKCLPTAHIAVTASGILGGVALG